MKNLHSLEPSYCKWENSLFGPFKVRYSFLDLFFFKTSLYDPLIQFLPNVALPLIWLLTVLAAKTILPLGKVSSSFLGPCKEGLDLWLGLDGKKAHAFSAVLPGHAYPKKICRVDAYRGVDSRLTRLDMHQTRLKESCQGWERTSWERVSREKEHE